VFAAALPFVTAADQAGAKPDKPARIAFGQKVDLADHVVPGKTTVFDFTSKYCGPCQAIAPRLDALHERRDDIVVVAVDINRPDVRGIDWRSPVARQYAIDSVPQFKIYGPDGKLQAEGDEAAEMVFGWLGES
jgi:thiol-disulfide isomerase/thioredoxin